MSNRAFLPALVGTLLLSLALATSAVASGRPFTGTMTGAAEVPGPGDPDGSGTFALTFNQGTGEVCFALSVENITLPATLAHVHRGTVTQSGPPVIDLVAPDATGTSSGCVQDVDRGLIKEIRQNPENFYVNVHTLPDFGPGAVRGQLSK